MLQSLSSVYQFVPAGSTICYNHCCLSISLSLQVLPYATITAICLLVCPCRFYHMLQSLPSVYQSVPAGSTICYSHCHLSISLSLQVLPYATITAVCLLVCPCRFYHMLQSLPSVYQSVPAGSTIYYNHCRLSISLSLQVLPLCYNHCHLSISLSLQVLPYTTITAICLLVCPCRF